MPASFYPVLAGYLGLPSHTKFQRNKPTLCLLPFSNQDCKGNSKKVSIHGSLSFEDAKLGNSFNIAQQRKGTIAVPLDVNKS